jgi:hypothetical protein
MTYSPNNPRTAFVKAARLHQACPGAMQGLDVLLVDALAGMKRMVGRVTASSLAAASAVSLLCNWTAGFTNGAAMGSFKRAPVMMSHHTAQPRPDML